MDRNSGSAYSSTEIDRQRSESPDETNISPKTQRKRALSHIAASLRFAPVPAMAVAGFIPEPGLLGAHKIPFRQSPFRASYHGKTSDTKYSDSPHFMDGNKPFSDVVGSAESLVGRVLYEQGLGKYCDPDFVRATQRELAEAFNMTQEGYYF
jgi:voltage-dependent calcium channel L type alpha-1D